LIQSLIAALNCIAMAYRITLIPGDGIGPEVTQAAVRVLEAKGLKFEWETFQAGAEAFEKYHEYIPKGTCRFHRVPSSAPVLV
jgi:isocitrate/isopropylmalate dehydrogenase